VHLANRTNPCRLSRHSGHHVSGGSTNARPSSRDSVIARRAHSGVAPARPQVGGTSTSALGTDLLSVAIGDRFGIGRWGGPRLGDGFQFGLEGDG